MITRMQTLRRQVIVGGVVVACGRVWGRHAYAVVTGEPGAWVVVSTHPTSAAALLAWGSVVVATGGDPGWL